MTPTVVLDTEIYRDYFLLSFLNVASGRVRHFEMFPGQSLDTETAARILQTYRLVSFNGKHFDLPLISYALAGATCEQIKGKSDQIIVNNMKPWQIGLESIECDHIDVFEVAPGVASLKIYGGRLHFPKMQDLPIDPTASISPEQRAQLREYCVNDLQTTLALFNHLAPQIDLRIKMSAEYGIDLRSKSDAQIAEAVIKHEVERRGGVRLVKQDPYRYAGQSFKYERPEWIASDYEPLVRAIELVDNAPFTVQGTGAVRMPEDLAALTVPIGRGRYKMGIGGLHSTEKSVSHRANDDILLVDRDVASYYPSIILRCGLAPKNMGDHFIPVYRGLVARRLAAKHAGDKVTADALKITINGSFGKFGSPYSFLYAPRLLIQTTITGQLALLMLIEMLEGEGISVVSANTDGIVIKCPRRKASLMDLIVMEWEERTGFDTEETAYRAIYSKDVNNYIAIKPDGGYKAKGMYAGAALQKNPTAEICSRAVIEFLRNGTPVETTVLGCKDVRQFVSVRTVKGGALDQQGAYLGKAVRWINSMNETFPLTYKVNGYTVAKTDGARAVMQLPDQVPEDLDYGWYIREALDILVDVGVREVVCA